MINFLELYQLYFMKAITKKTILLIKQTIY